MGKSLAAHWPTELEGSTNAYKNWSYLNRLSAIFTILSRINIITYVHCRLKREKMSAVRKNIVNKTKLALANPDVCTIHNFYIISLFFTLWNIQFSLFNVKIWNFPEHWNRRLVLKYLNALASLLRKFYTTVIYLYTIIVGILWCTSSKYPTGR